MVSDEDWQFAAIVAAGIVLCIAAFFAMQGPVPAQADISHRRAYAEVAAYSGTWVNASFAYKKPITVNGGAGGYDLRLEIDTAALVSAGKLQSDCDDLRFVSQNESLYLPYWIERDCNTVNTVVWVLLADSGNITAYYGAASAQSNSSGDSTFLFYDDFSDGSNWGSVSGWTFGGAYASTTAGTSGAAWMQNVSALGAAGYNYAIGFKYYVAPGRSTDHWTRFYLDSGSTTAAEIQDDAFATLMGLTNFNGAVSYGDSAFHTFQIKMAGSNFTAWINSTIIDEGTVNNPTTTLNYLGLQSGDASATERRIDDLFVRKFSGADAYASFGGELAYSAPVVLSLESPADISSNSSLNISFAFVAFDNGDIEKCALWTNESAWAETAANSSAIANNSVNYIPHAFGTAGAYSWNIVCTDYFGASDSFASNYTLYLITEATPTPTPTANPGQNSTFIYNTTINNTQVLVLPTFTPVPGGVGGFDYGWE
jgi:hypothetical protein